MTQDPSYAFQHFQGAVFMGPSQCSTHPLTGTLWPLQWESQHRSK